MVPIERLQCVDDQDEEDEQIEVEIIEVDENTEFVAMQDSCLQVTTSNSLIKMLVSSLPSVIIHYKTVVIFVFYSVKP